jgi:hypothetical protein
LRFAGFVVVALIAMVLAAPARGAAPPSAELSSEEGGVEWTGSFGSAVTPLPETCVVLSCDQFLLDVSLPSDVWSSPGGVQVGIRWPDENQDLDLYVYGPDGTLAGSSTGFPSTSESVLLESAANGRYRVVVVPSTTSELDYDGLAEVERAPDVEPLRELVPNLISLPPGNLHFATSAYLFDVGENDLLSCYPEETLEQGARRCLRFDQVIGNIGSGPLELRYRIQDAATSGELRQRIYRSDGSYRERLADRLEFHAAHAHFHYANFAQAHLWRSNAAGERLDAEPIRSGRKNGFCLIDVDNSWFGRKGDAARTYGAPGCLLPTSGEDVVHGISVGWADVYNWFLADQFVEVSGVPDGYYLLESVADPADTLTEGRDDDNTAATLIRLCGDRAEVVGGESVCD